MFKAKKIILGILMTGVLFYPKEIFSQILTIDSILIIIEKNQPAFKVYDAKINAINKYAEGAKSFDPPQVGGGFFMTPYDPRMWKADPSMNSDGMGSFMLSTQQMFMNPKKLSANSEYMKSMTGVEIEMKKSMKNEMFTMAKMDYYEWMLLKRKLKILNESQSILDYLIKSTELRYTYGMDKLNAYYKAKSMLGEIQNMTIMANQEVNQKRNNLNTLMNNDQNRFFDIDTIFNNKNYESMLIDSSVIIEARSDLRVIKQNENVLRTKQNYEQTKRLPDFGLKYDHMFTFGNQPQQFSIMAMVSIPIVPWSSKMYKTTVAGLNYEIEAVKFQQQSYVNTISGNLENLKIKIKSKKLQIELSEKTIIPAIKRNYETVLLAYEQNTDELFMVLDAWQNLKSMQLTYIDQLMELATLQIQYENQLEIK